MVLNILYNQNVHVPIDFAGHRYNGAALPVETVVETFIKYNFLTHKIKQLATSAVQILFFLDDPVEIAILIYF